MPPYEPSLHVYKREKGRDSLPKKPFWRKVNQGRITVEGEALKTLMTLDSRDERASREGDYSLPFSPGLSPSCCPGPLITVLSFCSCPLFFFVITPAPSIQKCALYINKYYV